MRMVVFVADQHTLARPPHAMFLVMFFEALETRAHRWILFWLRLFGAEGVVGEGVETDGFGLVFGEGFGDDGAVGVDCVC